jgi:hypothetical protein
MHHQGIICGVAFAHSSLRRIASYASVVAPRHLASDAFLVIRTSLRSLSYGDAEKLESGFGGEEFY